MKKFLTFVLCAVLVLGMIPASIFSAFAHGKGVAKNETENQSLDNAPNQYIPETITVDGATDDLGWKEWVTVDSASGVWDCETVENNLKTFSYKYSVRRDHEYLYVAVIFGDAETDLRDFNIYYSANNGDNVTTVSFDAAKKNVENAVKCVTNGGVVEFSYDLGEGAAAETISYYVSATEGENKLFYPAIYPENLEDDLALFDEWDSENALKITENDILGVGDNSLPEYIEVDGNFTEAYWMQMTDYYQVTALSKNMLEYKGATFSDGHLLSFDTVKYSTEYTESEKLKNDEGQQIRFKTDIRVDKNAIYGCAIVYDHTATSNANDKFTTLMRLHIYSGDSDAASYLFNIYYEGQGTTVKTDHALYKGQEGAKVSEVEGTLTGAAASFGDGYLLSVEFRIDLRELTDLDASTAIKVDFTAEAQNDGGTASLGEKINLGSKSDRNAINECAELGIDGKIETSVWRALLGYDNFVNGMKRVNKGATAGDTGDIEQFVSLVKADYEKIYGAALIQLTSEWEQMPGGTSEDYETFRLWINAGSEASYTGVFTVCLDTNGKTTFKLTFLDGTVKQKEELVNSDVEAIIVPFEKNGKYYAKVEYKIPVHLFGLDYHSAIAQNSAADSVIKYYVSAESSSDGSSGVVGPANAQDYGFDWQTYGVFQPKNAWGTNSNGKEMVGASVRYNDLTPQVVANSVHSEELWNEKENSVEFTYVDYSNSTVTQTTEKALSYKFKTYTGYKYFYGAVEIDSDDANKQFVLWIKSDSTLDIATHRFVIRIDENGGVVFTGWKYYMTDTGITGKRWDGVQGYEDVILKTFLKYDMSVLDGKTYIEFMLPLAELEVVKSTDGIDSVPFGYKGFEYYVSVEDHINNDGVNPMLYPAVSKLSGNKNAYSSVGGVWNDAVKTNAAEVEALAHIAPEVITIDGNLNDSGWDDSKWVWVSFSSNASLQGGFESLYWSQKNDTNFDFGYQLRSDGEYLYVGAVLNVEYNYKAATSTAKGGDNPAFRIWINPKDENGTLNKTFEYLYDVSAGTGSRCVALPVDIAENEYRQYSAADGVEFTPIESLTGTEKANYDDYAFFKTNEDGTIEGVSVKSDGKLTFEGNTLRAAVNSRPDYANGGSPDHNTGVSVVYDLNYGDSAFYGYTDLIQENLNYGTDNGKDWYADVDNENAVLANERAVICSDNGVYVYDNASGTKVIGNGTRTIVEFKLKISEFDPEGNGFEYSVTASRQGYYDPESPDVKYDGAGNLKPILYTLHYPAKYTEPGSAYNYWGLNFPYWRWYNGLDFADIEDSARLRNNCTPVVTLGAKICEKYIAPDNQEETGAIRFGARYEEKYIRYLAGMEDADYWDVSDMGIVIFPADYLGENELTLETEGAVNYPADNIVGWKNDASDGWSNFADYENFVFYITLWGIDGESYKNMDFAFRGYMTFYEGVYDDGYIGGYGTEHDFYSETIIRSFNEVKNVNLSEEGKEDDNSTSVLPDGNYESQPPVEDQTSKNS